MPEHDTDTPKRPPALAAAEIEQLAEDLTPEERDVILRQGTEQPFCGSLLDNKLDGQYVCRLCGLPLFSSSHKFDGDTGWPSFFAPVQDEHITQLPDDSLGVRRVEIRCARCDGHLGHVFEDGPPPTGQRHCLNSAALTFVEAGATPPDRLARLREH